MKPFKSGAILAAWLLRVMLLWFIYRNYFQSFSAFDFQHFSFYISVAYLLFGLLLLIGGFMQKPTLTVISGLAIFIIPIVQIIKAFPEELGNVLLLYLIPLAVGFYFFTGGNNN
jgi:hypothetical protein